MVRQISHFANHRMPSSPAVEEIDKSILMYRENRLDTPYLGQVGISLIWNVLGSSWVYMIS